MRGIVYFYMVLSVLFALVVSELPVKMYIFSHCMDCGNLRACIEYLK